MITADGRLVLVGTDGSVIDEAPLAQVSAKRVAITGGQTVSLTLGDRKYNATPGWGGNRFAGALGIFSGIKASKALVQVIAAGGVPAA